MWVWSWHPLCCDTTGSELCLSPFLQRQTPGCREHPHIQVCKHFHLLLSFCFQLLKGFFPFQTELWLPLWSQGKGLKTATSGTTEQCWNTLGHQCHQLQMHKFFSTLSRSSPVLPISTHSYQEQSFKAVKKQLLLPAEVIFVTDCSRIRDLA